MENIINNLNKLAAPVSPHHARSVKALTSQILGNLGAGKRNSAVRQMQTLEALVNQQRQMNTGFLGNLMGRGKPLNIVDYMTGAKKPGFWDALQRGSDANQVRRMGLLGIAEPFMNRASLGPDAITSPGFREVVSRTFADRPLQTAALAAMGIPVGLAAGGVGAATAVDILRDDKKQDKKQDGKKQEEDQEKLSHKRDILKKVAYIKEIKNQMLPYYMEEAAAPAQYAGAGAGVGALGALGGMLGGMGAARVTGNPYLRAGGALLGALGAGGGAGALFENLTRESRARDEKHRDLEDIRSDYIAALQGHRLSPMERQQLMSAVHQIEKTLQN